MAIRYLSILLLSSIASLSQGQEGIASVDTAFAGKVMEAIARRDQIRLGLFEYTIEIKRPEDTLVNSRQVGTYAFDNDAGKTFHFFSIAERKPGETTALEKIDKGLGGVIYTPDITLVFPPAEKTGFIRKTTETQSFDYTQPFEFRSFGFAAFGDYRRKTKFEEVLTGCLGWNDPKIIKQENGVLQGKSGAIDFAFDTSRDYWITSMNFLYPQFEKVDGKLKEKAQKVLVTRCEIKLKQVDGMWVPNNVEYASTYDGVHAITMDWKSLNSPLPKDQFEPQTLVKLVDKSFLVSPSLSTER